MIRKLYNKRRPRILIADDDPVFQELANGKLCKSGFRVELAFDGAEAMQKLQVGKFDLAIIDLVMPRIDGLRLIPLIRSTPRLKSLPILIVTSQTDPSIEVAGMQVGADDFLTKPLDWAQLPGRLNSMIGEREQNAPSIVRADGLNVF